MSQENDVGGWPETHELPIDSMTQEHKDALISKCSRKKDISMPNFVLASSPSKECKRRIAATTTVWRKRRRICMDFLKAMGENAEGTVSVNKCLKVDGQIDIDADEAVVAAAVEAVKNMTLEIDKLLSEPTNEELANPAVPGGAWVVL
jgi:hypothetical protein